MFPDFIQPSNCPPNSPDVNPVDYSIWEAFQRLAYRQKIKDIDHLKQLLGHDQPGTNQRCSLPVVQTITVGLSLAGWRHWTSFWLILSRVLVANFISVMTGVENVPVLIFLPARRYASAGLCDSDVSGRLSVRPSVRHTPVLCLAERKQDREMYTLW